MYYKRWILYRWLDLVLEYNSEICTDTVQDHNLHNKLLVAEVYAYIRILSFIDEAAESVKP